MRLTGVLHCRQPKPGDVADCIAAARVEDDAHRLLTGAERYRFRYSRPVLRAAGVGDRQRTSCVRAGKLDVKGAARALRGDARLEDIVPSSTNVHAVIEPLAWQDPPHVVCAFGGHLDVHIRGAILTPRVAGGQVVIAEALAAVVKILCLNRPGEG